DHLSLREQSIVGLIEKKMTQYGFVKAASQAVANIVVHYKYTIGPSTTEVQSSPDYVYGGKQVSSSTMYPRTFEIAIVDVKRSEASGKVEVIWHGEVYSAGASANMTRLAPLFIDVLFENYGKTVTNETFSRVLD